MTDRGLVKLFGCARLRRLELRHMPSSVTLIGITALTRGVASLERVVCVECAGLANADPGLVARAGVLGARVVGIEAIATATAAAAAAAGF